MTMESGYIQEYNGMRTECEPDRVNKENDKVETIWKIKAYRGDQLKGEWEFVTMRIDPHNPDPKEKFYIALPQEILKSGRNLVDKLVKEEQ